MRVGVYLFCVVSLRLLRCRLAGARAMISDSVAARRFAKAVDRSVWAVFVVGRPIVRPMSVVVCVGVCVSCRRTAAHTV